MATLRSMGEVRPLSDKRAQKIRALWALAPTHPVFYGLSLPDATGRRVSRGRPLWLARHARAR